MNKRIGLYLLMMCFCLVFSLVVSGCGGIGDKEIEAENKANEDKAADPGPTTDPSDQQPPADPSGVNTGGSPGSDKKEIPKDYPSEFCPIYEPSTIIDTVQINVEDKINYIIEFVSKDEMSAIEAFYLELDNVTDNLNHGNVLIQIHLENKSEKICGMINLVEVENSDFASYASEGYKIYGSILVDIGW